MSKRDVALPGDGVAVPEEFLPGRNVYETSESIRSLLVGRVVRDLSKREIAVKALTPRRTPGVGDIVIGQVESAQSSSANMRIYYLNKNNTEGGFTGVIFLSKGGRGGVRRTQVKLGDIVRAKVVSTLNAIIQLSIDDAHNGVIFSLCSNCGRVLVRANGRAKCVECGSVEERKFADDFGKGYVEP